MPIYPYQCKSCSHNFDEYFSIKDYREIIKCEKCSKKAKRTWELNKKEPGFQDKLFPYHDFALNKTFETPSDRKNYLKKKGMVQAESKDFMSRKQERLMYSWRLGHHEKVKYKN